MNAYEVDDYPTFYAAHTAEEARMIFEKDTGETTEEGFPRQLSEAELDAEMQFLDENEQITGKTTSFRKMLAEQKEPGFLCSAP